MERSKFRLGMDIWTYDQQSMTKRVQRKSKVFSERNTETAAVQIKWSCYWSFSLSFLRPTEKEWRL